MRSVLKTIGELSIVALTVTAIPESFAQTNLPNQTVCRRAINSDRSGWVEGSDYTEEASRRGLTFRACDEMNNAPVQTEPEDEEHPRPQQQWTREAGKFLEAVTYFITGLDVDPSNGDIVSNNQIKFGKYPAVIYLYEGNPCAVRLQATSSPYVVWQLDFCKITYMHTQSQMGHLQVYWYGAEDGSCIYRGSNIKKDENYQGHIGLDNSSCHFGIGKGGYGWMMWNEGIDIEKLVGKGNSNQFYYPYRSVSRMIASFKYIETLLTGKPY